ncbi:MULTISPECIES: DNA-3-methyladenine glycosylase family protein [unclassified Arthrobacter]|uniref:DNA-3-methyladenine glycosylase family protein n=1 Tax=unclassified Arthrobacter TaxID=235627 RepID=UPI004033B206
MTSTPAAGLPTSAALLRPTGPVDAPDAHRRWSAPAGYDLATTLGVLQRGTHDPCTRVGPGLAWLCFETGQGPATLLVMRDRGSPLESGGHGPGPEFSVRAWGPGAQQAVLCAPALLGAADDWSGFDAGARHELPHWIAEARRRNPGLRLPSTGRVFDALVPVILEQKVTTIEARHAWRYLVSRFGEPAPGPAPEGLAIAPGAHRLRLIGGWDWHRARVDDSRRRTVLRAAEAAAGINRLGAVELARNPGSTLQSVPGIGPWTTAETLQRSHGHPDAVSVGDFHLAAYIGHALAGKSTDDAGMLRLLAPFAGHRQRVVRLIGLSGFRKPSFGPRLAPMDHRGR